MTLGDKINQHIRQAKEQGRTIVCAKASHLLNLIASRVVHGLESEGYTCTVTKTDSRTCFIRARRG